MLYLLQAGTSHATTSEGVAKTAVSSPMVSWGQKVVVSKRLGMRHCGLGSGLDARDGLESGC